MIRIFIFLILFGSLSVVVTGMAASESQDIVSIPQMDADRTTQAPKDSAMYEVPKREVEHAKDGSNNAALRPVLDCVHMSAVVDKADVIIQGEVIKIEAKETKKNGTVAWVHTYVDIHVAQYVKGQGKDILTLKMAGGCAGGICTGVSGTPSFQVGQKGYLYLMNPKGDQYDEGRFYAPVCGRGMLETLQGSSTFDTSLAEQEALRSGGKMSAAKPARLLAPPLAVHAGD